MNWMAAGFFICIGWHLAELCFLLMLRAAATATGYQPRKEGPKPTNPPKGGSAVRHG